MLPVIFLNLTVLSLLMMETHTLLTSLRRTIIKGVGNFSVKYFKENDPTNEITVPKDVGTYTVKITVEEGDFYKESSGYLTSDDWKFAIKLTPTITTYTDEYDGDAHPVINIDQNNPIR